jgi:hypothetical protein
MTARMFTNPRLVGDAVRLRHGFLAKRLCKITPMLSCGRSSRPREMCFVSLMTRESGCGVANAIGHQDRKKLLLLKHPFGLATAAPLKIVYAI